MPKSKKKKEEAAAPDKPEKSDKPPKEPKKTKQDENKGKSAAGKKSEMQAKRKSDKDKKTGMVDKLQVRILQELLIIHTLFYTSFQDP